MANSRIDRGEGVYAMNGYIPLNLILYGLGGTGKSYRAAEYALKIAGADYDRDNRNEVFNRLVDEGRIVVACSHENYGYDEFMENRQIAGKRETFDDGAFKGICREARGKKDNYVIIVEDIDAADIPGEWMYALGDERREGRRDCVQYTLPFSREKFSVPANLYFIGIINSYLDCHPSVNNKLYPMFEYEEVPIDYGLLRDIDGIRVAEMLMAFNENCRDSLQIGPGYFFGAESVSQLINVFTRRIIPYLGYYCWGMDDFSDFFGGCTSVGKLSEDDGSHFVVRVENEMGTYYAISEHPTRHALENIYS